MRELDNFEILAIHGGVESKGYNFNKMLSLTMEGLYYGTFAAFFLGSNSKERLTFMGMGASLGLCYGVAKMATTQLDHYLFNE